jgi:hypothetical protein
MTRSRYLQLLFQKEAYHTVRCSGDVLNGPREARLATELRLHLLEQGINVIKTFLLTLQHTEADIDHLIDAIQVGLTRMREDKLL